MESSRRIRLTEVDRALWANYASRVRPLAGRERPVMPTGPERPVAMPARAAPAAIDRMTHQRLAPLTIGAQPGGVDSPTWHRFRGGKLRAARVLDLHGLTVQRAFHSLMAFLRAAHAEGVRCVEVVTGQSGVIRRELPLWLNLPEVRPLVLATAHPHAANPGAVRLLLRRVR